MIESFRDGSLRAFFVNETGDRSIPRGIEAALKRKLDLIDSAEREADLRVPPGNRFEHLRGNLAGRCSIRVNKQYRLIFEWESPLARNVYLDPHEYR
jgi:proteic killer suppression protein